MKNYNSESIKEYVDANIFWIVISYFWFNNRLFRCVEGVSLNFSRALLWTLMTISLVIGVLATYKRRRNKLSVYVNVILPYEIYLIITYRRNAGIGLYFLIALAVFLSLTYATFVLGTRGNSPHTGMTSFQNRIIHIALGVRVITACVLSVFVIQIGLSGTINGYLFSPATETNTHLSETVTRDNCIELLSQLSAENWKELPPRERLKALQCVADIEASELGLPHELNVRSGKLPETTLGYYNDDTHVIVINIDHIDFDSPEEILDSVCHEAYHAYQYRLCDLYDNTDDYYKGLLTVLNVEQYEREFANYKRAQDDETDYYFQSCEIDARKYARETTKQYIKRINRFLNSNG